MSNMDTVFAEMARDNLGAHLGVKMLEIKPGYARASLKVSQEHLNSLAITHGATVFALADMVFAAASNSHGKVAVALNMNINFIKATMEGDILYATAREDNLTNRTGLYRILVEDDSGDLVAVVEGLVYRKKDKINQMGEKE